MQKTSLLILLSFFYYYGISNAQNVNQLNNRYDTVNNLSEIKGVLLDMATGKPLPYANIFVLHKHTGTISNENGNYLLNINGLKKTDTVRFKYVGYADKNFTIAELDSISTVYLNENIFNLAEILVFGSAPDARTIVKKIVENIDSNYLKSTCKKQMFIRERYTSDLIDFKLNYKKSSIPDIDKAMIAQIENKIPKHSTSYSDFLGNFYFSSLKDDSVSLKIDPVKSVALKEKDFAEIDKIISVFEEEFKNTGEGEYWKVRTGIFSQKLDLAGDTAGVLSDTINKNRIKLEYFRKRLFFQLKYPSLKNKDYWEFLYKTGRYKYTIAGGTRVNGEDVYIIDFEPDNSGMYRGRMYVSVETYALIRADYQYAPGKTGTDFHLFGVGYTENLFYGSIYFEKRNGRYKLKYFSKKAGALANFDRKVLLVKKKERFLFDKTLNELKTGIELTVNTVQLFECLVLDDEPVPEKVFDGFNEKEYMNIIYVDKFDDSLWKGYAIIEPTRQMRDYRKHND
jgi:hypothetical protein